MNLTSRMIQVQDSNFVSEIRNAGGIAYFVGGCVRDIMMDKVPNDIDIVVCHLTGEQLNDIISKYLPGAEMVGKSFGVYKWNDLDIAHARTDRQVGEKHTDVVVDINPKITIEEDLLRRDFTINAMAIEISHQLFVDPYNGVRDLKHGIIRAVDERAFIDDPLRIVRAFQFKSRFGFRFSPNTYDMIHKFKDKVKFLPGERILEELKKVFEKGDPEQFIYDTAGVISKFGVDRKYPRIFEDMIYQMYGGGKATLMFELKLDSYTATACAVLHDSQYQDLYDMLPIISRRFPHLFESAYIPEKLSKLNRLCIENRVPRNLAELKEYEDVDGNSFPEVSAIELGPKLREELTNRLKQLYESSTT